MPGRASRPHGADVAVRHDPVVGVGTVEIEKDGPSGPLLSRFGCWLHVSGRYLVTMSAG